jgi:DNA-directed RNA polymerase subunit RPC12/RpoP
MGRECAECGEWLTNSSFSRNQQLKGEGYSRCRDCVQGYSYSAPVYQCPQCSRDFASQNQVDMHMQVHRPRSVSCPVCHETRFRSGANAVQHLEGGHCSGCRGQANARQQIYEFAQRQSSMRQYLNDTPMLTNGGFDSGGVPELPYHCPDCSRSYRQLSQLLQHQDQKHRHQAMLAY